jgi:eukaryotic-like serine/threonine-protein kinase
VAAIVDGDVQQLGRSYLLTLRLVTADSGRELVGYRATAATAADLIPTLGSMTRRLRGRIGESLKSVRESPPLEQATTPSLPALRKYTEALHARHRGETDRAIALLREAVAIDTGFTSAYARIAVEVASADEDRALGEWAGAEAFARRNRLAEVERLLVEQIYDLYGPPRARDASAALGAAEELMALRPDDWSAVNAVAISASRNGDLRRADSLMRRAIAMAPPAATLIPLWNLTHVVAAERRPPAELDSLLGEVMTRFPSVAPLARLRLMVLHGHYAAAADTARSLCGRPFAARLREECTALLADLELARGRVREHGRQLANAAAMATQRGWPVGALTYAARAAAARAAVLGDRTGAARMLDSALAAQPLDAVPEANRPYPALAWAYALAGRREAAAAYLAAAERRWEGSDDPTFARDRALMRAVVALASDRPGDALPGLRAAVDQPCVFCGGARSGMGAPLGFGANGHALLAQAHDLEGRADSALLHHQRYLDASRLTMAGIGMFAAGSHARIGELAESRGDTARARTEYERLVQLWSDADPELQPRVREVRARLAGLARPHATASPRR